MLMTITKTVLTLATLGDLAPQNSGVYCVVRPEVAEACRVTSLWMFTIMSSYMPCLPLVSRHNRPFCRVKSPKAASCN
jgi:hypothetical protein